MPKHWTIIVCTYTNGRWTHREHSSKKRLHHTWVERSWWKDYIIFVGKFNAQMSNFKFFFILVILIFGIKTTKYLLFIFKRQSVLIEYSAKQTEFLVQTHFGVEMFDFRLAVDEIFRFKSSDGWRSANKRRRCAGNGRQKKPIAQADITLHKTCTR